MDYRQIASMHHNQVAVMDNTSRIISREDLNIFKPSMSNLHNLVALVYLFIVKFIFFTFLFSIQYRYWFQPLLDTSTHKSFFSPLRTIYLFSNKPWNFSVSKNTCPSCRIFNFYTIKLVVLERENQRLFEDLQHVVQEICAHVLTYCII